MAGQGAQGGAVGPRMIAVALLPVLAMAAVLMAVAGAGASASPRSSVCGGGGTAQTVGNVNLDAEQMGNAQSIVSVVAGRHLPVFAAVVTEATAYTESKLHNSSVQSDHDSAGLLQQRVSIYTEAVASDPVKATNAFLDRLVKVANWQSNTVGVDAQTVQISKYPGRYQLNAALAQQLVGEFWSATAAAAGPVPTTGPSAETAAGSPSTTPALGSGPAICAGGGGAIPGGGDVAGKIVGPTGNNIAGTTKIPAGFVISGSAKGYLAVKFALRQLGKSYVFGAAGPNAFDCSGLTMVAWAAAGVALPHLAAGQTSSGSAEPNNLSQAVGGDLVMIAGSDGTAANPGHVGMVAGYANGKDGRHLFIVQAPTAGVPVELTDATEWSGQITNVRHIA
ncbi:C40 family peptidase [Jatrophihabitans lederbergiae]|jgi:cell wall-associated NlpC family hydrolase|uniref:NlpC/P60 family protein n=1 Tax=Jatrophihabitans lederbergiae TaxID=3075547 RepID=A0ABU2JBG6_9ACTN|nr:NlpC/P60 family protein [Jatrophihabitans sp. DSM 44399]MDT0262332.1 NlpC/P60 family protein [Jatrophihabitans sp. DSM 44399]